MNILLVGSNKQPLLQYIPNDNFLLIDDGPIVDDVLRTSRTPRVFDIEADTFDPLKDMDYRKAREFVDVLNAIFPEGDNTLTKRYSTFLLLEALLSEPKSLETLIRRSKETQDAYQKIQTLLLSPVLRRVLNGPTNMSFKGTIVARLDRAVLGDFDCFVLGNLLISQYQGTVVIPDFGFYACPSHSQLIRQGRLIAGINSFDEAPAFKNQLLLVETKLGSHCTPADAKTLALYAGLSPDTNAYADFIQSCILPGH